MSRIGRLPVAIPAGVEVSVAAGNVVTVKGPKGTLERALPTEMEIKVEDGHVVVTRPNDLKKMKACNSVLSRTGGDVYVSVMTIVSSVRQIVETPIWSIAEGASPVISYNYGARKPDHVKKSIAIMSLLAVIYMVIAWGIILIAPGALISVFSSDSSLISDSIPALKIYFAAFAFMLLQYIGQTTFKSLNKKKQAIFFSLLRKAIIVVPLTYLLPYAFHLGTNGRRREEKPFTWQKSLREAVT